MNLLEFVPYEQLFSPRVTPLPPPDTGIFDSVDGCRTVQVNPLWVPFINGVLDVLIQDIYWSENQDFAINEILELQAAFAGIPTLGTLEVSCIVYLTDEDGYMLQDEDGYYLYLSSPADCS